MNESPETLPQTRHEGAESMQQSDHDTLIRVHERVVSIQDQLGSDRTSQKDLHAGIEARVKAIESWKDNMSGRFIVIATVAAFVGSILATVVINLIQDKL